MKTAALWLPLVVVMVAAWSTAEVGGQSPDNSREQVAEAVTHFTLDLFKTILQKAPGNVILSPLSVQTLLAMLHQGAKSHTSEQLESVLHLSQATSRDGFLTVIENFQKRKYKSKLQFASRIFVQQDISVVPEFNSVLHTKFNAGSERLAANATEAASRINQWVDYQSKGRITELITPASITSRTQMILANVIYFKGTWEHTFDAEKTQQQDFHTTSTQSVKVPMMAQSGLFLAGKSASLKAHWLELPFHGEDFAMVLILPTERQGLSQVVKKLSLQDFKTILAHDLFKEVTIKMPRFRLDHETPLVSALQQLGLQDVFDQRSNLEGVSVSKTPLIVSDVLHRAEIEVNEEGAEASAASGLVVNTLSLAPEYEKVDFIADQPFLAVVVDKVNKMPLFVARVANPLTS